ncbi:aspartate/glutamate racemase family protein [Thalassobaculum sp.]|uniref:aspartate/glutamate racemase family protein n=1 Tax=Thalassobaculum sp. TaxID=2022740 RepID=UPI0032ED6BF5
MTDATERRSIRLINPNSDSRATERMLVAARAAAPDWLRIDGSTTAASPRLIVDDSGSALATRAVIDDSNRTTDHGDGVILSAFVDPGIDHMRQRLGVPVVGIGESSMREAAAIGRFAVLMTTPGLIDCVRRYATALGLTERLVAIPGTTEDPQTLMADADRLVAALDELIRRTVRDDGAEAVVVGGGPLADAARTLAPTSPVPLIEPVPAAVRRMVAALSRGDAA